MRLPPIPDPRDLATLLPRALALLTSAEQLLASAGRSVTDVDALLARIERTRTDADAVVARVDETRAQADVLLSALEPPVTALLPVLERLAETTDPSEVDALVKLVDHLPGLVGRLETEILPILDSLASVAPDLHDLLDVSRELNEMLGKVPGLGRIKKRVEEQQEALEQAQHGD